MRKLAKFILLSLLFIITAAGMAAWVYRAAVGLGPTHLGSIVTWGLWVAFYIYFIGLSAGSFLLSTLVYVFGVKRYEKIGPLALYSALIMLSAGLFFILTDLGHMERFWTVFVHRNVTSVLSWEIHLYILYVIILLGEIWFLLRHKLAAIAAAGRGIKRLFYKVLSLGSAPLPAASLKPVDKKMLKILGWLGIPTAIGVHGGTGAIFAVVIARSYWYSPLLPIIFLVSALASGGALLTFIYAFFAQRDKDYSSLLKSLARLTGGILCFDLLLMASELLVGLYGSLPEHMLAFNMILFSSRAWIFWLWQLGAGAVIPLILIFTPKIARNPYALGIAGLLVVLGIIGVRWNIVVPGYAPAFPQLAAAYIDTRITPFYSPAAIEYLSSIGIIGITTIIFIIGFKLLPILEKGE